MHCLFFICGRKFYGLTHARNNYATLEINPKPCSLLDHAFKNVLREIELRVRGIEG